MTYAILDNEGLHVVDPEIAAKIEGKELSASLLSGLDGEPFSCPAKWVATSFILGKFIETDNTYQVRGSAFHWVMEKFFKLPAENRTKPKVKEIIDECIDSNDQFVNFFKEKPEQKKWLVDAVKSYYGMGAKPELVKIPEVKKTTRDGREYYAPGIEIFVKGQLGNAKRRTLGFVDRIRVDRKNPEAIVIEDWKTGEEAKGGWREQRQQLMYTMLMEEDGYKVSGASLIYPVAQEVVKVDINNQDLRRKVISEIEEIDKSVSAMIEDNTFGYNPNFSCAWCPLVKICPSAMVPKYSGKPKVAYDEQPTSEQLAEGFEQS